jgi:hypothetical protein
MALRSGVVQGRLTYCISRCGIGTRRKQARDIRKAPTPCGKHESRVAFEIRECVIGSPAKQCVDRFGAAHKGGGSIHEWRASAIISGINRRTGFESFNEFFNLVCACVEQEILLYL